MVKTQNISENIELKNIEMKKRLLDANNTLNEINKLVANSSLLLENTHITGTVQSRLCYVSSWNISPFMLVTLYSRPNVSTLQSSVFIRGDLK